MYVFVSIHLDFFATVKSVSKVKNILNVLRVLGALDWWLVLKLLEVRQAGPEVRLLGDPRWAVRGNSPRIVRLQRTQYSARLQLVLEEPFILAISS
jgi:hypothetical protein